MHPIGFHVCLRLTDGRVLAPSTAARRALATSVLRVAAPHGLLAFRGSDTHLHLLLLLLWTEAVEVVRRTRIGLHQVLAVGAPFATPHFEPLQGQRHLANAFDYVLRQDKRHEFDSDPFHDASCVLDLLGLRVLDTSMRGRVREHIPRLREPQLLHHLGIERLVRGQEPAQLLEAAPAALGLVGLQGRSDPVVTARAAFVQLASPFASTGDLAVMLGCSMRTVQMLRRRAVPPELLRAVALGAGLRERLAAKVPVAGSHIPGEEYVVGSTRG
jgi:hypothetical protein